MLPHCLIKRRSRYNTGVYQVHTKVLVNMHNIQLSSGAGIPLATDNFVMHDAGIGNRSEAQTIMPFFSLNCNADQGFRLCIKVAMVYDNAHKLILL